MTLLTGRLDEVAAQSDDAVPLPAVADPRGLGQVVGHQRVAQGVIEGRPHPVVLHLHQVEQARHVLRPVDDGGGGGAGGGALFGGT